MSHWREIISCPATNGHSVTALCFDGMHEVIWSGCGGGKIHSNHVPSLEAFSHWQSHGPQSPVVDMLSAHGLLLSVSADGATLNSSGGVPWASYSALDLIGCCWEPSQSANRCLLGKAGGEIFSFDLASGRVLLVGDIASSMDADHETSLVFLRGPVGRGLVAAGLSSGSVALVDLRSRVIRAESVVNAHPGGLAYIDSKSDTLVTCGYSLRQGQVMPDSFVKLFDVRFAMKPMMTLTFNAGANCLSFHPTFSSVLLMLSASGIFSFADTAVGAVVQTYQVDTAGDALTSCTISSSGEMIAFGGSGGYVHLWTSQEEKEGSLISAVVNRHSEQVEAPIFCPPSVNLSESSPISLAEKFTLSSGKRLLSDLDPSLVMSVGLPPRVIDPSLLKGMKQVDFVGYLVNPYFSRGKAFGEATRQADPLRNKRVVIPNERSLADLEGQRAERSRRRIEQGGVLLPMRYKHIEIKTQSGLRFEEFDFSFYNRTRFAGLENNIPNCYCNALLQALYFIPSFREAVLTHKPEPDHEFCLVCEIHFLFRMLASAHGIPCQAANLLQALRQVREAAALGLLDGLNVPPGVVLPETEGPKALALSRRLASLQRFLLDHMHNLCKGSGPVISPTFSGGGAQPVISLNTSTSTTTASMKSPAAPPRSGIPQPDPSNVDLASMLEDDVSLGYRQRMICLGGPAGGRVEKGAEKSRDGRCFQVDLKYSATGSFASILQSSLQATIDTRAWFDEKRGYCMVRQSRVPVKLPKVLAINCSPSEMDDVNWWSSTGDQHQLPWSILIESDPSSFTVSVKQGKEDQTAADLIKESSDSSPHLIRVAYDLTCVISHIRDADVAAEAEDKAQALAGINGAGVDGSSYKGHLISCIRVPPEYWNEPYAPSKVSDPPIGAGRASMTPGSLARPSFGAVKTTPLPADPENNLDLPEDLDDVFASISFDNDPSGECFNSISTMLRISVRD